MVVRGGVLCRSYFRARVTAVSGRRRGCRCSRIACVSRPRVLMVQHLLSSEVTIDALDMDHVPLLCCCCSDRCSASTVRSVVAGLVVIEGRFSTGAVMYDNSY